MPSPITQRVFADLAAWQITFAMILISAVSVTACKADDVGSGTGKADAAPIEVLDPPTLQAVPAQTPLQSVVVEGITDGTRVVVQGGSTGTTITPVLPGGNFCQDVVLDTAGTTEINVYSADNGALSEAVHLEVTFDPQATRPARETCGGEPQGQCAEVEVCGNDTDDDCNSYTDECDLFCSSCVDDDLEPNDAPFDLPAVEPGTYALQICPCRDDWFSFTVEEFDRIRVNADFVHAQIDIDMRLYRAGEGGSGTGDLILSSATSTDDESIDTNSLEGDLAPGLYYLHVYPFGETKNMGSYSLTIF